MFNQLSACSHKVVHAIANTLNIEDIMFLSASELSYKMHELREFLPSPDNFSYRVGITSDMEAKFDFIKDSVTSRTQLFTHLALPLG